MITSVLIPADPSEESQSVLDFAAGLGALGVRRTVLTGSRGLAPWTEAIVGSVSLMLLRQAPCPVLVVP